VLACFHKRPAALKRLWFSPDLAGALDEVCEWMVNERLPFLRTDERDLTHTVGHRFHGGVAAITERPPPGVPKPSDYSEWQAAGTPLLILDGIGDPLQIGTIARIATATGITHLLLSGADTLDAAFGERAWSTANGALDLLTLHDAGEALPVLLRTLRDRFCIAGFTRPGGRRAEDIKPLRAPGRPPVIVLGGTPGGIAPDIASKCEHLLHIPGVNGSTFLTAADTAAYGLPWLLRKDRTPGAGFLARKKEKKSHANLP
jgi:TrmH RNA methyltransferase